MLSTLKAWARRLKRDVHAVYLAARDPRTPWYARAAAILVAACIFRLNPPSDFEGKRPPVSVQTALPFR
jgi:hypothetical protein